MFSDQEKIAIVSLLIEMANADKQIAYEEMITINLICRQLQIDHNSFVVGHGLRCEHAIEVLKTMSDDKKLKLAQMLVDIIDSDQNIDEAEIALLNHVGQKLNLNDILS